MTRKHLQWSHMRPDRLLAVSRSGAAYQIDATDTGRWRLTRFATMDDQGEVLSAGWCVDMKALAEAYVADALAAEPCALQSIAWSKLKTGHYFGVAPCGLAYRILKVGRIGGETVYQLARLENADAEHTAAILDDGPLASLKRRAVDDATASVTETRASAPALAAGAPEACREGQQT